MRKIANIASIAAIVAAPLAVGVVYAQTHFASASVETKAGKFVLNQPTLIDFKPDAGFPRFSDRQKLDQLRDWLLLTVLSSQGLSAADINQITYDFPTIRYDFMNPIANFEYGKTRSLYIGNGTVIALVEQNTSAAQRKDDLAYIADKHRKDQGELPKKIEVYEYQILLDQQVAAVTKLPDIEGQKLFTSEYGYYETTIQNQSDLQSFLQQVDDLSFAQINGYTLTVGGRKIFSHQHPGISIEDIAALWQSDSNNSSGSGFSLDPSFDYRGLEKSLAKAEPLLHSFKVGGKPVVSEKDIQAAKQGLSANNIVPYLDLTDKVKNFLESGGKSQTLADSDIGQQILAELQPVIINKKKEIDVQIQQQAKQFRQEIDQLTISLKQSGKTSLEIEPIIAAKFQQKEQQLKSLQQRLTEQKKAEYLQIVNNKINAKITEITSFLDSSETQSFQSARYDGNLQGTEVGMVLFYTDLLAKLWALNYVGSTPYQTISDFYPLTKAKVSSIYQEEIKKLPSTRLWFGVQDKGFQIANAGNNLLLARNATRIYAASSNPRNPGKETTAAADTNAFLSWWNDHYEEVARYEPQYERLNQIMKWSLVINWLNQSYQSNSLGFLQEIYVKRDNWFPNWVKAQGAKLKFQQWQKIGFFARGYKGTKTETMPLLASEDFKRFGGQAYFKGGVSLPNREVFTKRPTLRKDSALGELGITPLIDYQTVAINNGKLTFKTIDNINYQVVNNHSQNVGEVIIQPPKETRFRSPDAEVTNQEFTRKLSQNQDGLQIETNIGQTNFGSFNVTPTANGWQAGWQSREIDAGYSLSLRLSQAKGNILAVLQNMDDVVNIRYSDAEPNIYYVQMVDSHKWMRLADGGNGKPPKPPKTQITAGWPEDGDRNFNIEWLDGQQVPQPSSPSVKEYSGKGQHSSSPKFADPRQNPSQYINQQKIELQQRIEKIDRSLKAKNYLKADKLLEDSIKKYGAEPNLIMRKAIIKIRQGSLNIQQISRTGTKIAFDKNTILDEINRIVENNNFQRIETDQAFFYVQNHPGLNNRDWNVSVQQSVPFASGARLYKIQAGKIGGVKLSQSGFNDASASSYTTTKSQVSSPNNRIYIRPLHLDLATNECQEDNNQNPDCPVEKPAYIVTMPDQ